ncbi:MAG: L,D-transpeptidase family protein [Negativicutes bacterium]|nr:L,D-transpeptidase family protein [Negativicutes bacterium]
MLLRTLYLPHRLSLGKLAEDEKNPRVADVQKLLKARGLFDKPVDGVYSAETREAIARFQELAHIAVTGQLDPITYCRLLDAAETELAPALQAKERAAAVARPNILINRSARRLTLFSGNAPVRQYPIAVGKPSTPTPLGNFAIATKIVNPGGVLGTRWMGLSYDSYGIHGTNKPWLIGQMVSNGCIRMHNHNAEDLFNLVVLGTPVYIRD